MTDIYFINDTTTSENWGCRATTRMLRKQLEEAGGNIKHTMYLSEMKSGKSLIPEKVIPKKPKNYLQKQLGIKSGLLAAIRSLGNRDHREAFKTYESITSLWDDIPGSLSSFESCAARIRNEEVHTDIHNSLQDCDLVVINGEGSIYDRRRKGRMILFIGYLSKEYYDTDCILVNHTAEISDPIVRKMAEEVYPRLDDVVFREPISARKCSYILDGDTEQYIGADSAFRFDPIEDVSDWCSFANRPEYYSIWPDSSRGFDLESPYICIGGSSIFGRLDRPPYDPTPAFKQLIKDVERDLGPVVLTACSSDKRIFRPLADELDVPLIGPRIPVQQLVDILGNASLYIGGRWHSSVLALTGGTPLITFTANTHKTQGIVEHAGLDQHVFEALQLHDEIDNILTVGHDLIESDEDFLVNRATELEKLAERNVRYL